MSYLAGKWNSARWLARFARYLRNWPSVWSAFRANRPVPALRFRGGLELAGGPEDDVVGLFHEVFVSRCYTDGFYRPAAGDTVVDVGANIGTFAVFMMWLNSGVRMHCFEPAGRTRQRLAANLTRNGLAGKVTVHPEAVSGAAGTVTLRYGQSAGHTSVVASEFAGQESEVVPSVTLAQALDLCGGGPVSLLKIDTEGSEVDILRAAPPDLARVVERVVVEYHGRIRPEAREAVQAALRGHGYGRTEDVVDLPDGALGLIRASR